MTKFTKPLDAEGTVPASAAQQPVDVSPEAIAALVAAGAQALHELPDPATTRPDALPLLVGITHDLRSPLSSMLVLIERLRAGHAGPVTPLQEKQLGLLYSAAFGVASLTNDALDMARGAVNEVSTLPPVAFSVSDVWHAVRSLVQPIAEEKGLLLRWSGLQHDRRLGNTVALQRVLLNLVTNALKFTDSGSVTVSAEALNDERVRFVVRDTGRGLPAAVKARLDLAPRNEEIHCLSSGGLGIALCQQMLAAVGSELVQLPSVGERGTALGFTVTLRHAN